MKNQEKFFKIIEGAEKTVFFLSFNLSGERNIDVDSLFDLKITDLWQDFMGCLDGLSLPLKCKEEVSYAMAAFVDEAILLSDCPCKESWSGHPLQLRFFGEQAAGEGFYSRLHVFLKNPGRNLWSTAFYGWLLRLGFKGKFISTDDKERILFVDRTKESISLLLESNLENQQSRGERQGGQKYFSMNKKVNYCFVVFVLFLVFSYMFFYFSIRSYSKEIYLPGVEKVSRQVDGVLSKGV